MGRWRPPQKPGSKYITAEGHTALQDELNALWRRRREVVKALAAAAAEGDRSENAEYIYRKKELGGIDRRIRYLQRRLPDLQVVAGPPADRQRVYFGAWVTLEDAGGDEHTYRIVGPDEFDRDPRYVSVDAPLARSLLGRGLDDEVVVRRPGGEDRYAIVDIAYR